MTRVDTLLVACGVVLVVLVPQAWSVGALYIGIGAIGDPS